MRIRLNDVRLAFPNLWEATAPRGSSEKAFSAAFILPKTHPQLTELRNAMKEVAKAKWGAKWETVYKALEQSNKLALHDGDTKAEYEGYEGNLFVNSRSKVRPLIIDTQRQETTQADGLIFSGCRVNASLELWAQDNDAGGKRINAQLRGVQFFRKDAAFSGGGTAADTDEFDEIGVEGTEGEVDPLTA